MASNKQLNATITIGGAVSSSLKSAFGTVAKSTERVGGAIADLTRRQKTLSQSIQTFGRQGKDVDGMRQRYAALGSQIDRLKSSYDRLNRVEAARERNLAKREGYKSGIMGTVALGASVAVPVKAAMDFETTMADVRKVVDFDTPDGLRKMGDAILEMSTRLPMAANDIGKIVAAGGQSGIAAKDLTAFAEAAIKMGVAFDISAEEAGQSMAELRSAFRLTQPQVNVLADKINYLGNNTAASAKDIMEIVQRIGPLGEVAGSASGSIAAMGATLRGMGVANEIAATGIKNMLLTLTSGKAATKAQVAVFKQLGFTATQVSKSMQLNADETIRVILAKISRLPKHAQASALAELFGKESIGAIAPLLTNLDQLQGNLKLVGDATKYAGSMNKEYEAAAATTANQVKLFNGQVNALGVTIGSVLLPAVNGVLKTVSPWIGKVVSLAKEHPVVTQAIVGTAGALATLTVVTYGAGFAWTFLKGGLLNTVGLFARVAAGATLAGAANTTAAAGTTLLGTAFRFVGKSILWAGRALLMNPIGLAVTAIAGGAYLIYKNWEPLKKWFTDLWADITATFDAAIGKIVGLINSVGEKWNTFKTTVSEGVGDAWKGTKQFFGIDDDSSKPATSSGAPVLVAPAAPAMANRSGGTQITTNDSYQISVQASPGMNEDALARKVAQQLRQQQAVRQRSMMTDGAYQP